MGEVANREENTVPGFGVGGFVVCPLMSITHPAPCLKQGCELWNELITITDGVPVKVGRCSFAWLPRLTTEVRQAINNLKEREDVSNKQRTPTS